MKTDLFGTEHLEPRDVARKAITMSSSLPFYKIETYFTGVTFFDENNNRVNLNNSYGVYAIYKDKICLYVGETFSSIYYRIYRFQKELKGLSRNDENHPAASKARQDGLKDLDGCLVKFIPHHMFMKKVDEIDPDYKLVYGHFPIDEYVAPLLKAKYNTRKAHV
jgi:hypothetical protein